MNPFSWSFQRILLENSAIESRIHFDSPNELVGISKKGSVRYPAAKGISLVVYRWRACLTSSVCLPPEFANSNLGSTFAGMLCLDFSGFVGCFWITQISADISLLESLCIRKLWKVSRFTRNSKLELYWMSRKHSIGCQTWWCRCKTKHCLVNIVL